MRQAQLYALLLGVLQTVVTLLVFAFGLHSSPESLSGGHRFENLGAFVVMMACLSFGMRAVRRTRAAAGQGFNFAAGARTALVISSVGGLVTSLGQYLYAAAINPGYAQHLRASLISGSQLTSEQAAAAAPQLDVVTSPLFRAISQGGTTLFFSLFIGLAYAFLFRDRSVTLFGPDATAPGTPRS